MTYCTTYLKHHFLESAVAMAMLLAIGLQSTGAVPAKGPDGGGRGNIPGCHCCHGKVFLKLDKRYDLKPLVLLSTPFFQLAVPTVRRVCGRFLVVRGWASTVVRPAALRGPPCG
jgi:hypothetical protein